MPDLEFADEPFDVEEQPAPRTEKPVTRATPKKKTAQATPAYKQGVLVEPLTVGYGFLGMGIGLLEAKSGKLHMPVGTAIVESAEKCAEVWDEAAKTSPAIRRVLYKLVGSSNVLKIGIAHAPIAAAVANEIPAVQKLSRKVGTYFENLVNVDVNANYTAEPDGQQYAYPNESYA